jgi:hypothetical protein
MASKIEAKTKKAKPFDVFISYNWDVKPQVLRLYKILTEKHDLRVWIDEYEMGSSRLNDGTFIQIYDTISITSLAFIHCHLDSNFYDWSEV